MQQKSFLFLGLLFIAFGFTMSADWVYYQAPDNQFKLKFPQKPLETAQDASTEIGPLKMNIVMHDASKYKDENLVYQLMYIDYPDSLVHSDFKEEIVDVLLEGSINGALKNVQGKLLSKQNVEYKGYPGKYATIDYSNGLAIIHIKLYLVNNRMYALQVICETKKDKNASIQRFFDSLEVNVP